MSRKRKEWMLHEGTPRSVVTGNAIIDAVDRKSWNLPRFTRSYSEELIRDVGARGHGYAAYICDITDQLEKRTENVDRLRHRKEEADAFTFEHGTGDQDFTWHFSGLMAMRAAYQFRDAGLITDAELKNATLSDWADIIGSQWFSDLIHDMAVTANGTYGILGKDIDHYHYSATSTYRRISGDEVPVRLFDVSYLENNSEDIPELSTMRVPIATLSKQTRGILRRRIQDENDESSWNSSIGCPVARKKFEAGHPDDIKAFDALALRGLVSVHDSLRHADQKTVQQYATPIDRYLIKLADMLVETDLYYGSPEVTELRDIVYRHAPKQDCFLWREPPEPQEATA